MFAAFLTVSLALCVPPWHMTQPLPARGGAEKGLSAMYAAGTPRAVIVAGGANFPNDPVWEGGAKAFYSEIYAYRRGQWQSCGTLPQEAAYGMSAPYRNKMLCVGGANRKGSLPDVYLVGIRPQDFKVLPSLPKALQEGAAVMVNDNVYVLCGNSNGEPQDHMYVLNLKKTSKGWRELAVVPEAFSQPVAAAFGDKIYLWGGFNPKTKNVSGKGYRYDIEKDSWNPVVGHPMGEAGTFTGSSLVTLPDGTFLCCGGVDKEVFSRALRYKGNEIKQYQSNPIPYFKFQNKAWIFDPLTEQWIDAGEYSGLARAGASLVAEKDGVFLLGGELKPGVRTEKILSSPFQKSKKGRGR